MPQPGYIQNVPVGPYAGDQLEIQRKQRLAQMLQQQAMQPIEAPPQQGAFAAPISPLAAIQKAMQGYVGKEKEREASKATQSLSDRMQQERQTALAQALRQGQGSPQPAPEMGGGPAMPPDPMGAAGTLMNAPDPSLQQMGGNIFAQQMKPQPPPQPFSLSPGQTRFGPDGKPIANLPAAQPQQQPFTLAPGATRYGPDGKPIVTSQQPQTPQVAIDMKGESEYSKKAGGMSAERDFGQHDAAQAAVENLHKLNITLKQIKESNAITGMGSEVLKNVERAKALFLQDKAAGKRVSDTEFLDALLGSDVFPMIKQLGIGARGLDTPAEREFLRNVMTGTTPLNRETLVQMTEIRRDIAERAIKRWNERVEGGDVDRYFRATGMPKRKVEMPKFETGAAPQTQPQITEGATASGPNGQRIIFRGGRWQPM